MARPRFEQPCRRPLAARLRANLPELIAAVAAFALVVADLDPTGTYAWLPDGPGLSVDESFNVEQGVRLEVGSRYLLLGAASLRELFGTGDELGPIAPLGYHLADHPPLGRYLLGVAHDLVTAVAMPTRWPTPFVTAAARFGSAAAFAATVFLVAQFGMRRYGRAGGLVAGTSLVLMPRVFGHAHFAALETMIGLFFTATVLVMARGVRGLRAGEGEAPAEPQRRIGDRKTAKGSAGASSSRRPASPAVAFRDKVARLSESGRSTRGVGRLFNETPFPIKVAVFGGFIWALALLTKVQAVLLPIPIAAWALWHWRLKAVLPLAVFGSIGGVGFFAGWPWLWFDPIDHVFEYLGRTTDRISLPVWYMGRAFADRDVPWHYPFVMFAVTVPVGLHVLGLLGVASRRDGIPGWRDRAMQLVLACLVFPLVVFAVPGIAVYDGARLFLVSFPLWAVLVGRGGAIVYDWLESKASVRTAGLVLAAFVAFQSYGIVTYRPYYLSYYNALVGGLAGAERLGFEPTYWGDSVTAGLLDATARELPEGSTLAIAPALHQFQLDDLLAQSPVLREKKIKLVEHRTGEADPAALLIFARKSALSDRLRDRQSQPPLAIVERKGVTLAAVYELPPNAE